MKHSLNLIGDADEVMSHFLNANAFCLLVESASVQGALKIIYRPFDSSKEETWIRINPNDIKADHVSMGWIKGARLLKSDKRTIWLQYDPSEMSVGMTVSPLILESDNVSIDFKNSKWKESHISPSHHINTIANYLIPELSGIYMMTRIATCLFHGLNAQYKNVEGEKKEYFNQNRATWQEKFRETRIAKYIRQKGY